MRATGIKKGMVFKKEGTLFQVVGTEHITPGKGNALMQVMSRDIRTGKIKRIRFRSTETVEVVHFEYIPHQLSYTDSEYVYAMNLRNYETESLPLSFFSEYEGFMKEEMEFGVAFFEDSPIAIDFPKFLEFEVTYTELGLKGDSVTNHVKPITLDTGAEIKAPLFINIGDKIKVDIIEKSYVERVK